MEDQLGAGEEPDDQGESTWTLSHPQVLTLSSSRLQAAYLEARTCRVESRYLEVLRQLQDTKSLDASQQEALQKLVEDALRTESGTAAGQQGSRYGQVTGRGGVSRSELLPVSPAATTPTASRCSRTARWRT